MAVWLTYRDKYLDYLIELESFGSPTLTCFECGTTVGAIECPALRCMDCFRDIIVCPSCCVHHHHQHPLHRIEVQHQSIQSCLFYTDTWSVNCF